MPMINLNIYWILRSILHIGIIQFRKMILFIMLGMIANLGRQ